MLAQPHPPKTTEPFLRIIRAAGHALAIGMALLVGTAQAQVFERSIALPPADVELIDSAGAAHLENAKRFLAEKQWAEAVEAIRRVQEAEPSRLIRVDLALPINGFERYITIGEYCQWRLAALAAEAPEALAHYRRLVDPLAENWLREGVANNDEAALRRVVRQAFASSAADEALLKLGDLALARGDHATARASWQRLAAGFTVSPAAAKALRAPVGSPLWLPLAKFEFAQHGAELKAILDAPTASPLGCYPDTDLDVAAIRARLVLCSILEGSPRRAELELQILRLLQPEAEGAIAGRTGRYVDLLASLREEAAGWPPRRTSPDWTTFAGDATRDKVAAGEVDPAGEPLWSFPLPRLTSDRDLVGSGRLRVADDMKSLRSYYPVVVSQTVLVRSDARGHSYIIALDLRSGQELWRVDSSRGLVQAAGEDPIADAGGDFEVSDAHADLRRHFGVARYTLSVRGERLLARMGSPITVPRAARQARWTAKDQGFLLGLDLKTQGKPLDGFPIRPESNEWTFEGPPLEDGQFFYTAMRRVEGSRSQLYLAAYELQTTPGELVDDGDDNARPRGRLRWRTRLASAATLGGGEIDQLTQLLVTLDQGRLYLNTSAGVVAAVNAADGKLLWLVKYPRTTIREGDPDRTDDQLFRDLTPCMAYKDLVIVAPADSDRIFALEGATGQLVWSLPPGEAADAVHLLGAQDDVLLASGDRLYWVDANAGRVLTQFPAGGPTSAGQAAPSPRGLGRGTLAAGHIWYPTRESIFVFKSLPAAGDFGYQPKLVREIPLAARGLTGGNLVIAQGVLLIATGDRLVAFDERGPK